MKLSRIALALFALILPGTLVAQPPVAAVAGWRIASGGTSDGGRFVRLSRNGRGYHLVHYLEFWRGNNGVAIAANFRRGACRSGDAEGMIPTEQALSRATFDMRLAGYLRECPLARGEAVALRRSLNAAWPRFLARARRALAATEAENRAIENYGR